MLDNLLLNLVIPNQLQSICGKLRHTMSLPLIANQQHNRTSLVFIFNMISLHWITGYWHTTTTKNCLH